MSPLRFRARKTIRLGPLYWTFTQAGYTGWGIRVGPWRWSARSGRHSLNTPGIGGVTWGGRRKQR